MPSQNLSALLMRLHFTSSSFLIVTATILVACESKSSDKPPHTIPATTTEIAAPSTPTILTALYGKAAGDSAVYDRGKLVETSNPARDIVANVLQKQVFQRHDSTLCLVTTSNAFDWGAGAHTGWVDAALFLHTNSSWNLMKVRRQAVWGGAFGSCDCQAQGQTLQIAGKNKVLAFVRAYNVHGGEFETNNVITDDLRTSADGFLTYSSNTSLPECADAVDAYGDTLRTGFFVKKTPNQDDQLELVSFELQPKNGKCLGVYKKRAFTYNALLEELKKPHVDIE